MATESLMHEHNGDNFLAGGAPAASQWCWCLIPLPDGAVQGAFAAAFGTQQQPHHSNDGHLSEAVQLPVAKVETGQSQTSTGVTDNASVGKKERRRARRRRARVRWKCYRRTQQLEGGNSAADDSASAASTLASEGNVAQDDDNSMGKVCASIRSAWDWPLARREVIERTLLITKRALECSESNESEASNEPESELALDEVEGDNENTSVCRRVSERGELDKSIASNELVSEAVLGEAGGDVSQSAAEVARRETPAMNRWAWDQAMLQLKIAIDTTEAILDEARGKISAASSSVDEAAAAPAREPLTDGRRQRWQRGISRGQFACVTAASRKNAKWQWEHQRSLRRNLVSDVIQGLHVEVRTANPMLAAALRKQCYKLASHAACISTVTRSEDTWDYWLDSLRYDTFQYDSRDIADFVGG